MSKSIFPRQIALTWLDKRGFDWDEPNTVKSQQILRAAARHFRSPDLINNVRITTKKGGDTTATILGTLTTSILDLYFKDTTRDKFIKWMPSEAKQPDHTHALNYYKVMKESTAKKRGLSTRYGCRCGFSFVSEDSDVRKINKHLEV